MKEPDHRLIQGKLRLNPMNLQLFAGEKTEEATPRKRQKAREQGQVLRSVEINSALILLGTFLAIKIFGPYITENLMQFTQQVYIENMGQELTYNRIFNMATSSVLTLAKMSLPILGTAFLIGIVSSYVQVGFLFTTETLTFKLERLNPISGFKRIFSLRSVVELFKSIFKISIVGYVSYKTISDNFRTFPNMLDMQTPAAINVIMDVTFQVAFRVGLILLILAVLDYAYQWWDFEKNLKMSKQDVKDEFKQVEGDPLVKGKIKQKQRQMAMRRMMQEVPKADVVITNPTHFAIALKYDLNETPAPQVIAKGMDLTALKIKEIAKEHKIPVVENKPLARALYAAVDIGGLVPAEMYQAVAEVLAFVYKLKQKAQKGS